MDELERKTRAVALREELRNGRNGRNGTPGSASETTDGTSQVASGFESNDDSTFGAALQDAGRAAQHFTPTGGTIADRNRRTGNNGRGTQGKSERPRRRDRRSEKDNGGTTTDSTVAEERTNERRPGRGIGRLITDVEIDEPGLAPNEPESTFEGRANGPVLTESSYTKEDYTKINPFGRGVAYALKTNKKHRISTEEYDALPDAKGKSTKQEEPPATDRRFFKGGVLSQQEAEELYEPLVVALSDSFGYLDKALWSQCPQLDERPIWSNTTDKEDAAIAKLMLKQGQKSPAAAAAVRTLVDSADYIMVGMAVLPRIGETVEAWRGRPAPDPAQRKGFSLFRKDGA